MNHKIVENVKRDRERIRYAERFGKEVPHFRPRVWVRLPLNFKLKLRPVISIMLNSLFTRLQYKDRNLIPKIFFFSYEPSLDLSSSRIPLQDSQTIHRFHDLFAKLSQFPNSTLRLNLSCNRDWQTRKNTPVLEGQTTWFFLETPFCIFNSARSLIVPLNVISMIPLSNEQEWLCVDVLVPKWLRRWWRLKYLSGL